MDNPEFEHDAPQPDLPNREVIQDKKNATAKAHLGGKDPKTTSFDPAVEKTFIHLFLGTDRKQYEKMIGLITTWYESNAAQNDPSVAPAQRGALKARYDQYVKENFPNTEDTEINRLASGYFNFYKDFVEENNFRNGVVRSNNWQNVAQFAKDVVMSDVRGIKPAINKKLSMRDQMRRSFRRTANEPELISILLRNSFISFRMQRPTIVELSELIDNINAEIRDYVTQVNGNSLTLSRMAIIRVVWRFVAERITTCSVKDTDDFADLADNILWTDFRALCMGLIGSVSPRGVKLMIEHNAENCNWHDYRLSDPGELIHHRPEVLTDEQAAVLANLNNGTMMYSREEITALQKKFEFGVETRIYTEDRKAYFELAVPTLATCFTVFDQFIARLRPSLDSLRINAVNAEQLNNGLIGLVGTVSGSEYAHWVDRYVTLPDNPDEEQPEIMKREDDTVGFSEGVFDILDTSMDMSTKLQVFVEKEAPRMTHTLVGIPNFICPQCKGDTKHDLGSVAGVTPIDPLMLFFIHTRLTLVDRMSSQPDPLQEAI